jgi:flagellar protein FlbT
MLTITLKPDQEILLSGAAVISNGSVRSVKLRLHNKVPFLLRKDVLSAEEANTPVRRAYFMLQCMYLDPANLEEHRQRFNKFVTDLLEVTGIAELRIAIQLARTLIETEQFPQALKALRDILPIEQALLSAEAR